MASTSQLIKSQRPRKYSTQHRNRCSICGRQRAYYRKFGICRICMRNMAHRGLIPGMRKASW